jgi:DNA-binding MarR family transcriptional regulator
MARTVRSRQHVVKSVRPARTVLGDAFTEFILEAATLGGIFTALGERLAKLANQTLARWVILDASEDKPSTVAEIARRRGIARQAVQRVADLLERDGLVSYTTNPGHRRSRLLRPTARGREVLHAISVAQKAWADALGAEIGATKLKNATALVSQIRREVSRHELPVESPRRRLERRRTAGPDS